MARLERKKTLDESAGKAGPNTPGYSDRLAEDAWIRIEQFRRLTSEEIRATLEDSGMQRQSQEPQKIRYSARVQVIEAISRETFILHRKLATVLDRTHDTDIRKLLKALHLRYLGLDIEELCEDGNTGFICELIEKANAYLAKTNLGLRIHLRNRFALLGPEKRYEPIHIVNNLETRKTMHYDGAKIAKPAFAPVPEPAPAPAQNPVKESPSRKPQAASPIAPTSPKDSKEAAPEEGSYLKCVRDNRDKFKGKQGDKDYKIAEGIAQAADKPGSALRDEDGTTIHELEKTLKIADHTIAPRLGKIGRIFEKIGITLDIEETIADADMDEAEKNPNKNYFYRITLFWTTSLESDSGGYEPVEKEGEDGNGDEDGDDEDEVSGDAETGGKPSGNGMRRGVTPSRGNVEYLKKKEDPDDIFPAFRGVEFTTAVQFNAMIVEILTGSMGICTYELNASSEDARKLMRSIEACEVDDSIKDRVEEWKRRLSLGIKRCKKYGCLYRGAISGLLRGINVEDDKA